MVDRRSLLAGASSLAFSSAMAGAQTAASAHPLGVIVSEPARPRPDIASIFDELGLSCSMVSPEAVAAIQPGECDLLWIVSSTYPEPSELSPPLIQKINQFLAAGKGVFAEFVTNFPDLSLSSQLHKSDIMRLFFQHELPIQGALPAGTILDEQDSMFLPSADALKSGNVILAFGLVPGVQTVVPGFRPENSWPGLILDTRGSGKFALATTSLSEFRRRQYAPQAHWEQFLRQLTLLLLPDGARRQLSKAYFPLQTYTEPRNWVLPGDTVTVVAETEQGVQVRVEGAIPITLRHAADGQYQGELKLNATGPVRLMVRGARGQEARSSKIDLYVAPRKEAYRRALERNIRWYEQSSVLVKADGTAGVAEWISGPDIDGNRNAGGYSQIGSHERADCVFQSGLAFWLYGKDAGSRSHQTVGLNMLERVMDFQRLGATDPGYGLWNTRARGGIAFQDDTSWATICALAGYRYTRRPHFQHRGLLSARAQLNAFGPDDRRRVPLSAGSTNRQSVTEKADAHPHFGGCVLSAWLYTYGMTGERVYLDMALPMLADMIDTFDTIDRYIISKTCESSRFLLPLALACAYTGDHKFRRALDEQAAYLRSRMAPCGAIQEDGSNIGDRVRGGDLGLTYDQRETISDQLYCTSFASMNFWIAYKATGDPQFLDDFYRVTDYLVRIQIDSDDRTTNGGWMRGFDYSLWEYYGANADTFWTPYSMETGWQNAIIDMALALYLLDDTFYQSRRA